MAVLPVEAVTFGENRGRGNVLALRPVLKNLDYRNEEALRMALEPAFHAARAEGILGPKTIVVLPEYIGLFLYLAGEGMEVYETPSLHEALKLVLAKHKSLVWKGWFQSRRVLGLLLEERSEEAVRAYEGVVHDLASRFEISIVGGSTLVRHPDTTRKRLANACLSIIEGRKHWSYKRHPVKNELERLLVESVNDNGEPLATPAGPLGISICADCWYPEQYDNWQNVELIVCPGLIDSGDRWDSPWQGYDPGPPAHDVDRNDVGALTEKEAWLKYALPARAPAEVAVATFLRGKLWDIETDGHPIVKVGDDVQVVERSDDHHLWVNVWH
jgi:predicted amidohydrolase